MSWGCGVDLRAVGERHSMNGFVVGGMVKELMS